MQGDSTQAVWSAEEGPFPFGAAVMPIVSSAAPSRILRPRHLARGGDRPCGRPYLLAQLQKSHRRGARGEDGRPRRHRARGRLVLQLVWQRRSAARFRPALAGRPGGEHQGLVRGHQSPVREVPAALQDRGHFVRDRRTRGDGGRDRSRVLARLSRDADQPDAEGRRHRPPARQRRSAGAVVVADNGVAYALRRRSIRAPRHSAQTSSSTAQQPSSSRAIPTPWAEWCRAAPSSWRRSIIFARSPAPRSTPTRPTTSCGA